MNPVLFERPSPARASDVGARLVAARHSSTRLLLAAAAASLFASGVAHAEVTLVPYVNSITTYESNVFRVDEEIDFAPDDVRSKSDAIFNNAVGLEGNYRWLNQRLYAVAEASRFQYLNNSQLDQNAFDLSAGLDWSLLSRVTGTLTASNTQTRSSFANGDTTVLNRQRQRDLGATTRFKPGNDVEFLAGFLNSVLKTPAVGAPNFEVEQNNWNSALNYIGINRLTIGVTGTYSSGQFSGTATNSKFEAYSGAGTFGFRASDISNFRLSLGYTTREDSATQSRNQGLTGSLVYERELTGKTSANLGVTRSVDASQFGDNTVINTGANFGLNYNATARITSALSYSYLNSKYKSIGEIETVFSGRTDDTHTVTLRGTYDAFDWLKLTPSVAYETRTASRDGFDYTAWIVGIQLAARLE